MIRKTIEEDVMNIFNEKLSNIKLDGYEKFKYYNKLEINNMKLEIEFLEGSKIYYDLEYYKNYYKNSKICRYFYKKFDKLNDKINYNINNLKRKIDNQYIVLLSSEPINEMIVEYYESKTKKEVKTFIIDNVILKDKVIATYKENLIFLYDGVSINMNDFTCEQKQTTFRTTIKFGFEILDYDNFWEIDLNPYFVVGNPFRKLYNRVRQKLKELGL